MSLRIKVFFVLLGFSLLLIFCMAGLMRWSFQSGFNDYIQQMDIQRLQAALPHLTRYYAQHSSWTEINRDRGQLTRILLRAQLEPDDHDDPPDHAFRHSPGNRHFLRKVYLLDASRRLVQGNYSPSAPYPKHEERILDQGNTVGYVGVAFKPKPYGKKEAHFAARQIQNLFNICLLAMLLSFLLSWPISALLVKRIHVLNAYIRKLSQSHYQERVALSGRDELNILAEHLNNLAATLEKNQHSRRKLVADVSHELRTPITTLKALLEAIEDGIHPYNPSTHQRLNHQVTRLQQLIDDLYQLSLSDLGALQYHKTECNLTELINHAIADVKPQLPDIDALQFTCDNRVSPALTLLADPQRLQQLFSNLLQNSLRYTQTPGTIQLMLEYDDTQKAVRIHLQDSAPGIPDAEKSFLFEPFYRAESSRNREFGGAGLGLNLCKNIVDAHQGHIQIEDSDLGGLHITVTLPVH